MSEVAKSHCSRNSEVLVNDRIVDGQLRGGRLVADGALLHEVDALARLQRQRHVLLDQQDGDAFLVQDVDDLADLRDHARHQSFGRLVQQDDLGLQHHGAGDGQHLLLAARQRATGLRATLGETREIGEGLVQQLLLLLLGDAVAIEAGAQVLHHSEQLEDAPVLRHVTDAEAGELVRRHACDGLALEQDFALARIDQPHDGLERGALADAVAAQQPDHLAGTDLQRDAVQDVALAVEGVDVLDGHEGLHRCLRRTHVLR